MNVSKQFFLLEQFDQLSFQEICGYLEAQSELFHLLNEALAQDFSIDLIVSCFNISSRISPSRYESVEKTIQNFSY